MIQLTRPRQVFNEKYRRFVEGGGEESNLAEPAYRRGGPAPVSSSGTVYRNPIGYIHADTISSQSTIPMAFTQDMMSNASQTSAASSAHRAYGGYATQGSVAGTQSEYASQVGSVLGDDEAEERAKMTQDSYVTDQYLSQTSFHSQRFTQY